MNPQATAHIKRAIRLAIVLVFLAPPFALAQVQSSRIVFEDHFDGALKPQWSANHVQISTTPVGQQHYLGPFGGESVLLNLADLPDHQLVRLSIDLLISGSWYGNTPFQGPDVFYIYNDDGRVIDCTSFGWKGTQAYPGFFSVHTAPAGTGANAINTIGITPTDGIFHIECVLPHRNASLGFRFLATPHAPLTTKAWGILNAKVTLEAASLAESAALLQAWDQLASDNPAASVDAVWRLVGDGEPAVKFLSEMLAEATIPPDVELLDPARVATRRKPTNGKDGYEIATSAQRRSVLAAHVLQIIGTDAAKEAVHTIRREPLDSMRTVKLTVRDNATGEPVPFLPVLVTSASYMISAAIVADSTGHATIDVPAELVGSVRFQNPNCIYVPVTMQISSPPLPASAEYRVERAVTFGGVVIDDNQKPIAGASVYINIGIRTTLPNELQGRTAVADQFGRWAVNTVPAQPLSIQVGVRPPGDPMGNINFTDFAQRLPELRAGAAKIVIPHQETLHATVVDADSAKPVEKFHVRYSLTQQNRQTFPWQPLSAEVSPGTFEVLIPPNYDAVSIRVEADDYVTATYELIGRERMHSPLNIKLRRQIVEILLEDPANRQAKSYLNLDDGKTYAFGESTLENFIESRRWIDEKGVDLMCETRQPAEGLVAYDMVVIPTDTPIDRPRDYDELKKLLDESQTESFRIVSAPPASLPKTYIVRTREGALCVLEASAAIENPKGLRLRYRVVPKPAVENNSLATIQRQQVELPILIRDLQTRLDAEQNGYARLRQSFGGNNAQVAAMVLNIKTMKQTLEAAEARLIQLRLQQLEQQRALVGQQPAIIGQQRVQPQLQRPRIPPAQDQAAKQPEAASTTNPIRQQTAP